MNSPESDRYKEIDRDNLNKPVSELRCPRCESAHIQHDREISEHPGVFFCGDCYHTLMA